MAEDELHLLQKRSSRRIGVLQEGLDAQPRTQDGELLDKKLFKPKKVVFKIGLKTGDALEGSEVAFAQSVTGKLQEFLRQNGATTTPALSAEGLAMERARFVEFLDTPPPHFSIRREGWIMRLRRPVGSSAHDDVCFKRRSTVNPDEDPELVHRMLTATNVTAKYNAKVQWIAGSDRPAFQLYTCFKTKEQLQELSEAGLDLASQQTVGAWSHVLPGLAGAAPAGQAVGPNGLRIRQEEVPLTPVDFVTAAGDSFKFKPSVILWFDEAETQPRRAFTGELTWDLKLKTAKGAKEAVFDPIVAFLSPAFVETGSKTAQAYSRMQGAHNSTLPVV